MLNCISVKCIYIRKKKNHSKTSNTYSWGVDDDRGDRFGLNKTAPRFGLGKHLQNHCVVTSYTVTEQGGMTLLHNAQEPSKPTFFPHVWHNALFPIQTSLQLFLTTQHQTCCHTPARRSRGLLLTVSMSQVQPQLHWSCSCAGCQEIFKQNIVLFCLLLSSCSTAVLLSFSSACFSPSVPSTQPVSSPKPEISVWSR